jgi:colicin import membrane protein
MTTDTQNESAGALALVQVLTPMAVYGSPEGADKIIAEIEKLVNEFKGDISTEEGREAIKSFAYKISRSKTALDDMATTLTEGWRKNTAAVNAERKRVVGRVQELQDRAKKPLTDWLARDGERIKRHREHQDHILALAEFGRTLEEIEKAQADIADIIALKTDYQEFSHAIDDAIKSTVAQLAARWLAMKKQIDDNAELERLRAADAKRQQDERDAKIAADAAAKAQKDAEEKAAREAKELADKAAAEQKRLEDEKATADRLAKEANERAEQEKEDRLAAAAKAEQDAKDAETRRQADLKAAADKAAKDQQAAIDAERKRVADEEKAKADADAKRAADQAHKGNINNEALAAMQRIVDNTPVEEDSLKAILIGIIKGDVPHVKISY